MQSYRIRASILLGSLLLFASQGHARYYQEVPVPQDERVFTIDESLLPFDSLEGTQTTTQWGGTQRRGLSDRSAGRLER